MAVHDPSSIEPIAVSLATCRHREEVALLDGIRANLADTPGADLSGVDARMEEGRVLLVGAVPQRAMRAVAVAAATSVAGGLPVVDLVVVVDDHIEITQSMAADADGHRSGAQRGASPQESGLVPSALGPGPWADGDTGPGRLPGPTSTD